MSNGIHAGPIPSASDGKVARPTGMAVYGRVSGPKIVTVPLLALRPGESPRSGGEDRAHIAWLAETEGPLPPILVDRRSMRVIDGMHRLMAASLKGREKIDVEFFDGSPADAFVRAVQANVTHGLPLSQADRRAAAARIISSHPHMSDRAIGESTGLAAKTVAAIRRRSTDAMPQLNARVGRDGRVRPLSGAEGRRRAAELLAEHPRATLREVARAAGVSPATAGDVRKRLERGDEPGLTADGDIARVGGAAQARRRQHVQMAPELVLEKLLRDPSLRHNEQGRLLLRLLQHNAIGAQERRGLIAAVPPHCVAAVVQLALHYAQRWESFAQDLEKRARVVDPLGSRRISGKC